MSVMASAPVQGVPSLSFIEQACQLAGLSCSWAEGSRKTLLTVASPSKYGWRPRIRFEQVSDTEVQATYDRDYADQKETVRMIETWARCVYDQRTLKSQGFTVSEILKDEWGSPYMEVDLPEQTELMGGF